MKTSENLLKGIDLGGPQIINGKPIKSPTLHKSNKTNKSNGDQMSTHYVIEPGNMSRYELIYTEYTDPNWCTPMSAIVWLSNGRGGLCFTWPKGDSIYASYAFEKSKIGSADLAPILLDVKRRFPGSIRELYGYEAYDENGVYRGLPEEA